MARNWVVHIMTTESDMVEDVVEKRESEDDVCVEDTGDVIESVSASYHAYRAEKSYLDETQTPALDVENRNVKGLITNVCVFSTSNHAVHDGQIGVEITYGDAVEYLCLPEFVHKNIQGAPGAFERVWNIYHTLLSRNSVGSEQTTVDKGELPVNKMVGSEITVTRETDTERKLKNVPELAKPIREVDVDVSCEGKTMEYGSVTEINGIESPYNVPQTPARVINEIGVDAKILTDVTAQIPDAKLEQTISDRDDVDTTNTIWENIRSAYNYGVKKQPVRCTPVINTDETSNSILVVDFIVEGTGNELFSYSFPIPGANADTDECDGDIGITEAFIESVGGGEVEFIESESVYAIPKAHKNGVDAVHGKSLHVVVETDRWIVISEPVSDWGETFRDETTVNNGVWENVSEDFTGERYLRGRGYDTTPPENTESTSLVRVLLAPLPIVGFPILVIEALRELFAVSGNGLMVAGMGAMMGIAWFLFSFMCVFMLVNK